MQPRVWEPVSSKRNLRSDALKVKMVRSRQRRETDREALVPRTGARRFILVLAALLMSGPSAAQVVLDPDFSPDTVTSGEFAPGQTTDYLIRESFGQRSGNNLFHRFSSFDLPAGQSATFVEDAAGSGIRLSLIHI